MSGNIETIAGFHAPVHRSLSDPILLGGAPRTVAIANGTLAAAIALGVRVKRVGISWRGPYIVREQGQPLFPNEPHALTKASATTLTLTNAGKGHQHQRNWVAVVRDTQ